MSSEPSATIVISRLAPAPAPPTAANATWPNVLHTRIADVARAMGRVLVHEIVHAVAPKLSHADRGVMHDALLIGALSNVEIEIDDRTREEFLRGLNE